MKQKKRVVEWSLRPTQYGISIAVVLLFIVQPAHAVWNAPTCNPDAVGGPTDPSCNVSAPLNISTSAQTKVGALTVQNTLSAASLNVSYTVGGNGRAVIDTLSGTALVVTQGDPVESAIVTKSNTTKPTVSVRQDGTGSGVSIDMLGSGNGIEVTTSSAAPNGILVTHNHATAPAINVTAPGQGVSVTTTNNGSIGVSVKTSGSSSIGVKAQSAGNAGEFIGTAGGDGVYAESVTGYGVSAVGLGTNYAGKFCNGTNRCAAFGGSLYSGLFTDRTLVTSNGASSVALFTVEHKNTSTSPGIGIEILQSGNGTGLVPVSVVQGTALSAQAVDGYGVFGYSQKGTAGYFETPSPGTALKVVNSSTAFGPTKYAIEASATTPQGIAIQAKSDVGIAGRFESLSGGVGVEVAVQDFGTAIQTGTGIIKTEGAVTGGQFFPGASVSDVPYTSVDDFSAVFSIDSQERGFFDGSHLWVPSYLADMVHRIDPIQGKEVTRYNLSGSLLNRPKAIALLENTIYVFGNGYMERIPLYGNFTSSPVSLVSADQFTSALTVGGVIWLGTEKGGVYVFEPSVGFAQPIGNYGGSIEDLVSVNDEVWASEADGARVLRFNAESRNHVGEVSVGDYPRGMVFDGAYVWVANFNSDTVSKINAQHPTQVDFVNTASIGTTPIDVAFDGVRLWISLSDAAGIVAYNVAQGTFEGDLRTTSTIHRSGYLSFDGTALWAQSSCPTTNCSITKFSTGQGRGYDQQPIRRGVFLNSTNNVLHCVYVDNAGALVASSSTFAACE